MEKVVFSTVEKYLDENKGYLFDTLTSLIKINTENNRKTCNESALTSYPKGEYEKIGVEAELYTPDTVAEAKAHLDFTPGKDFSGRENLTAKLPGKLGKRSVMLA